jgi:ankyrin repeat protein
LINLLLIAKNLYLIIVYKSLTKQSDEPVSFRPENFETIHGIKMDKHCSEQVLEVLVNPPNYRDENGNTELHTKVRSGNMIYDITNQAKDLPYLLFVLNNKG